MIDTSPSSAHIAASSLAVAGRHPLERKTCRRLASVNRPWYRGAWQIFTESCGVGRDASRVLQLRDNHIDDCLAIQAAEHGLGRIERSILEILVHRRAAAAKTVILTCIFAVTQSACDITTHTLELFATDRRGESIRIHIAYREIAVMTARETQQFRRVGSEVAFAIHAQYRARRIFLGWRKVFAVVAVQNHRNQRVEFAHADG